MEYCPFDGDFQTFWMSIGVFDEIQYLEWIEVGVRSPAILNEWYQIGITSPLIVAKLKKKGIEKPLEFKKKLDITNKEFDIYRIVKEIEDDESFDEF